MTSQLTTAIHLQAQVPPPPPGRESLMPSQLTVAIHRALLDNRRYGLTALSVTFAVRKQIPRTPHATVKGELVRLVARGTIAEVCKPHLPRRYKLARLHLKDFHADQ